MHANNNNNNAVHGVWMPQSEALFDISVVDTDIKSYCNHSPMEVLALAEKEKGEVRSWM